LLIAYPFTLSGCPIDRPMRAYSQPATIGNARRNGVTELLVYCTGLVCSHSGTLPFDGLPDDLIIKSLDRRMVCTKCGRIGDVRPHFIYRPYQANQARMIPKARPPVP
jgi:hypothetical protein